jgi:3-oxoacid CoA-transferase A subunit
MGAPEKIASCAAEALGPVTDGATVIVGGFGDAGIPFALLDAVAAADARHLTIISVNAGRERSGIARLISEGRVDNLICCFPRTAGSVAFEEAWAAGAIRLELVPMGTLVARLQAGASGTPAFFSPVGADTDVTGGKEVRFFEGRPHVLEFGLRADLALVHAHRGDRFGNLAYRGTDRNLNPLAARAADRAVAEVALIESQPIDPERVETPGLYVHRLSLSGSCG